MNITGVVNNLFYKYINFFLSIGYFGEFVAFFITLALIYKNHIYSIIYIIVFLLNASINQYLKAYIKEDRPKKPVKFLDSDNFSQHSFGMPSGHSQNTFFSIMYAYLVTRRFIPWILFLLVVGIITIYERYKYRNHTISQLFTGAILGSTIAYLTYSFTTFLIQHYIK